MSAARLHLGVVASHPIQYQSPLWRALARRGLSVEVLYMSDHGMGKSIDADFGRAVEWDSDLFSGFSHRFLRTPVRMRPGSALTGWSGAVGPAIVRGGYDAILVCGYSSVGYLAALAAGKIARVPVYLRAETVSARTKASAGFAAQRLRNHEWVLRRLLRSYAGLFPIGEDSEEFYVEAGVSLSRCTRAPYGVENRWFARPTTEAIHSRRDRMGCRPGDYVVLHAGKLIERKRPEQAVRTARALRDRGVPARAVIVGSGPRETEVRRTLHDDDVFVGFVNQSELPELYASADVVVFASTYETWGLVVNEALAAGTPVLASPYVPAAVEMAGHSSAVRVLATLDAGLWAEAAIGLRNLGREECATQATATVADYDTDVAAAAIADRIKVDLS